ncbi:MAG: acetamidase/formamidase family protein [Firmicutes bacterium]|nr:acetamidase/formamidase family protein [Bacillota bacterium]MCL5040066.1 acetamidase/formamidase family protein [Bacillota bacterium]
MKRIEANQVVYALSRENPPAATADPGETLVFLTKDCFSNQIQKETDLFASVGWATINPATGPVAVNGAEPGDTLAVEILDIEVAGQGSMIAVPGLGALSEQLTHSETKIVPIVNGKVIFNSELEIPIRPMIGVIGTAPAGQAVPCGTPGPHGGNMDTRFIGKGARLYLPVFAPGALLALGDLHAVMGDGEVVICGVEIPGQVTVKVDLIKAKAEPGPVLETAEAWYTIASAPDLDEASQSALQQMFAFIKRRIPLPPNEVAMLLSITGNLQISQVVDPLKTVRMEMPKWVLKAYGVKF